MSKRNKRSRKSQAQLLHNVQNLSPSQIDIVIPVYGEFEYLDKCLDVIPEAIGDIPYRVYVVDNASPDQEKARAFFSAYNKPVKLYSVRRLRQNVGYPGACNVGANSGSSPFILILTPDVWYRPNAIKQLYQTMKEDDKNGIVAPKLLFPDGSPHGKEGTIQHAGLDMAINTSVKHTFIGWSGDHPKANVKGEIFACTGASFLIRRPLWRGLGGYFDGYGKGTYEDVDLCIRARVSGFKVMYEPLAVGTHRVNATNDSFPINQNAQLFSVRLGKYFSWTEWMRL